MFTTIGFFLVIAAVNSSHFLGGTISWRVQNSATSSTWVAILITQTYSWTYTTGKCENGAIAAHQPVPSSGGTLTCSPSCPAGFGSVSATPYCTDVSPLNGIVVGQRSDIVLIPEGSDFSVIYASDAWGSLTLGGYGWSISSHINLVNRSDNGMLNHAPVATIMSPIIIPQNKKTLMTISVSDADGDTVRCRWSTNLNGVDECGSICPPSSLPANTVIYPNCTIEITGTTAGTRYALAIMAEDFITSASTTPLSTVPVQFLVEIMTSPSCSILPEILHTGKSCTPIKVNETFISQVLAVNHCGENVTIIDIATLSFSGMTQGSLVKLSSLIYYKTITWTPTIDQLGYQVMCAMALNNQYAQSSQYCFTFFVTENGTDTCPGVIDNTITTIPSTTILMTTTETSTSTTETSTSTTETSTSTSTTETSTSTSTTSTAIQIVTCFDENQIVYSRVPDEVDLYDSDEYSDDGFVNNRRYVKLRLDLDDISSIKKLRIKIKCTYNRILSNESIEPQLYSSINDQQNSIDKNDLSLLELFHKTIPYDIKIEIGTHTFHAHRHILMLRSDYFKTSFGSHFNDCTNNPLKLSGDIDVNAFDILLKYLYTNRIEHAIHDELLLIELFKLSDRFLIDSLKHQCLIELLRNHINKDNVFSYLDLLDTYHGCDELREKCFGLFHKYSDLLKTPAFNHLEKNNPKLALQIYGSFF
ncbi:unnamed protein product [Rotaria sp. Silwood1]|nr:unnamed protein product [Rotaria sp. Silwood1]